MSNRQGYSRENKKCLELLADMRKKAGNKTCAECGDKQATWCSTNLGVFVCIRCSGVHRKMGTHISKVKSSTLDKWTLPLFEHFKRQGGNTVVNSIFEAKLGRHPKPQPKPYGDDMEVEAFIRDKYEHKTWYSKKKHKKWLKKLAAEEAEEESEEEVAEETPAASQFSPPVQQSQLSSAAVSSSGVGLHAGNFMDEFQSPAPANDGWTDFSGGFSGNPFPNGDTTTQRAPAQRTGDSFFTDSLFEASQPQPPVQAQGGGQGFGPFFGSEANPGPFQSQPQAQVQPLPVEKPVDPEQLKKSRNSILGKFHEKPQAQFMTQLPPNVAMQQGLMNAQMQQMQMQQMQQMQMQQRMRMAQMQQMQMGQMGMQGQAGMGAGVGMGMGMGMPTQAPMFPQQQAAGMQQRQHFAQMGYSGGFPQTQQFPAMGYQGRPQVVHRQQSAQQPRVDLSQPVHFGPPPKRQSKSDELFADLMA